MLRLKKYIYLIYAFFLLLFTIGSLFMYSTFCMVQYGDKSVFIPQKTFVLVILAMVLFIVFKYAFKLFDKIERLSPRRFIPIVILSSLIAQLMFIYFFQINLIADMAETDRIAKEFLNGNFSALQPGAYMHSYPHNIGITLYLSVLYSIFSSNLFVPRIMNILFTTLISLLIYLIYHELKSKKSKKKHYGILIIASFFPPAICMNNLVYNDIISCFFFLVSVYFAIKYVKNHTIKYALLSSIFLSIGNFLRPVGIIFLLAIIIYIIISRLNLRKIIHFILLAVVIINIPFNATSFILQKKGVIKKPLGTSSAPALMWINMSIGKDTFGYWDGGESYKIYLSECKSNKEASEKVFKEKIKQKVKEMGILGLTEMYFKKSLWLWTEGTYQCLYYGMSHTQPGGYSYETPVSKFFVENLKRREYINWILYATNYLINIVILIALIMSIRKNKYKFSLFVIIILGFIGFYLIWETKPRYIYLCYPYLILLSYTSLRKVFFSFESIINNKFSQKFNKKSLAK